MYFSKNHIFKCSEKVVFQKKFHRNLIFLVLLGKMKFLFPENMILFCRWKMKDHFSQKNAKKYIFCIFDKDGISFFYPSVKKAKMIYSQKIYLKMTFTVPLKKMIFILENMVFLLIEKLKMIKNFTQSNTHSEK